VPRLLIVDDHAGFRAFARALLETDGFEVVGEAADATGALDAALLLDPDIVLLDVVLPDGDGFEVCERLLAVRPERPAVVLTSSRDARTYGDRLTTTRARGFLAKESLSGPAILALVSP
jgi:DNA-binding NarL/FixJ family response regulator